MTAPRHPAVRRKSLFLNIYPWPSLLLASTLLSATAQAHVPYLAPESFEPIRGWVSLEASFADKFFLPEAKFDQSEFKVVTPAGKLEQPAEQQTVRSRIVLEHQLTQDGSYRFSSGVREGAVFRSWLQDGKTINSRDPKQQPPAGVALTAHFQSITLAETYVSQGKPTAAALKPWGKGLELEFISHPNDLYINQPVQARLWFEGKPLANSEVQIHRAMGNAEPVTRTVTSTASGDISFEVTDAATYLLLARHRAAAPAGAKAPTYSYSYSAVVEITD
jgi:uncharacterized GH25 family protein